MDGEEDRRGEEERVHRVGGLELARSLMILREINWTGDGSRQDIRPVGRTMGSGHEM